MTDYTGEAGAHDTFPRHRLLEASRTWPDGRFFGLEHVSGCGRQCIACVCVWCVCVFIELKNHAVLVTRLTVCDKRKKLCALLC